MRDAIEMVTRAVSRDTYQLDTSLPKARLNPYRQISFSFIVRLADERRVEVAMKEGILPARFFELIDITSRVHTDLERRELDQLKRELAEKILSMPTADLFELA